MSSLIGLGLICSFPNFFTREQITITETEFEIGKSLDFRYWNSLAEAGEGDRSDARDEVARDSLNRQIFGNTTDLERAEVRIQYL